MQQEQSPKKSPDAKYTTPFGLLALVGELGFMIAVPLLVMAFIGVKLDKWLGHSPLFLIIGMVIAAIVSSVLVLQKVYKASKDAGL